MDFSRLNALHTWFDTFVSGFYDTDAEGLGNIMLKVEHTRQVCRMMELLAAGEGLSPGDAATAGAVALLHDAGRFPQYRKWRTFRDSDSDNHARLAVEVMDEHRLLDGLPEAETLAIREAVRFHNVLKLPERLPPGTDLFAKLIRDADKLDIWRLFVEHCRQRPEERATAATLGFPDLPEVSDACVADLARGTVVRLDQARFVNDFKLMQISWVYDLNFPTSYRLLLETGHLAALAETLPRTAAVTAAVAAAMDHARVCAAGRDTSCTARSAHAC